MEEYTSSHFRANMAQIMQRVLNGFPVRITAKGGNLILQKEIENSKKATTNILKPKIKGEIIGSLEEAEQELKEYIQFNPNL